MKIVTTIKGPPKAYKTAMLILVANEEAKKGRGVTFSSADDTEEGLRRRGLDERVRFVQLFPDHKDFQGRVTSYETPSDKDFHVWRVRQAKKGK